MKYWKICLYFCISGPVTGSLPVVPAWVATGLESVWCWERRTGSCPVLALCGISKVYYHALSPICLMSFTWITLRENWVQNDKNRYELLMIMYMFMYNLRPVTDSLPAVLWWAGTGLESVWCWEHRTGSCPAPAFCITSAGLVSCTGANPFHEFSINNAQWNLSIKWERHVLDITKTWYYNTKLISRNPGKWSSLSSTTENIVQSTRNSNTMVMLLVMEKIIANRFNIFFLNVGESLAIEIMSTDRRPSEYITYEISSAVTEEEICKIIRNSKDSAAGWDDLRPRIMKLIQNCIKSPLAHICNRSFMTGILPSELKIANVVPVFKSGDDMVFSNYRPVFLLPVLSKIIGRLMYNRLILYINRHGLLYEYQFWFQKGQSTHMALITLIDKITEALF